jgi:hypothetical protein
MASNWNRLVRRIVLATALALALVAGTHAPQASAEERPRSTNGASSDSSSNWCGYDCTGTDAKWSTDKG